MAFVEKDIKSLKTAVADIKDKLLDIEVNVDMVNEVAYSIRTEKIETVDTFFTDRKRFDHEQISRRFSHIKYLHTLDQEIRGVCTCGKHKGIDFVAPTGQIIESGVCPVVWWLRMSRIALEKRDKAFLQSTPLESYLKDYMR